MSPARYSFGEYELDPPRFELRRAGRPVALQPKALDLILYLVRQRDRVVAKDELLAALWPDVVVTEASLTKAVAAARRALGDDAEEQAWITTVRGRGFRFAGAIEDAGVHTPETPAGGASAAASDFVGREDVLAAIDAALESALGGEGRMLSISGDAGMGKTRTSQEAGARAVAVGFRVVTGWCHESAGAPDLWPWLVCLRQVLEQPGAHALVEGLGDGMAELGELLPALRAHLPEAPRATGLEPESARFRRLETLVEILRRAARRAPHLLVLDDFHRADPDSLSLLRLLVHALADVQLVVLVTHRNEELGVGHPLVDLARAPSCRGLLLSGLERAQVAELVRAVLGGAVPESVTRAIQQRSDGNPFFVKELARGLAQGGHVEGHDGRSVAPLPAGIRHLLHEKLARLSDPCRELLVRAALLGRDLDVALLAHASDLSPRRTMELLDEACAEHVIRQEQDSFRFAHSLLREELLAGVAASERVRLHRAVGEALLAHFRDDRDPHLGRIAHHLCAGAAAGGAEQAVRYARQAGERAVRLHGHREAAEHYGQALDALGFVGRADPALRCDLLLALGEATMASGRPREGRSILERAAAAARVAGLPGRLARAALVAGGLELSSQVGVDDPALIALLEEALETLPEPGGELGVRLRTRLGEALYWSAWERSVEAIERAVAHGRRLGDPVALGYALYGRQWLEFVEPGPGARVEGADEMLALARTAGHRELALAAHSCRFLALLQHGRGAEARIELARYQELARELRVPRYRWRGHCYHAALAALEGRFDDVESAVDRAIREEALFLPTDAVGTLALFFLRREQDRPPETDVGDLAARLPAFSTTWRAGVALMLADAGRLDEARDALVALTRHDFVESPHSFNRLSELVLCTDACAEVGDPELAARLHERLLPYGPRMVVIGGGFFCLGSVDLFLGRLAATAGWEDRARQHLTTSLEANARAGARPWLAWTRLELARARLREPGAAARAQARDLLAAANDAATGLRMPRLARLAAALADRA